MARRFRIISTVMIYLCGWILHMAYMTSGGAAWSYLISSIGSSPWELTKPFLLVDMGWILIELSCLRPSLLHYVSARILSLHFFGITGMTGLWLLQLFPAIPLLELWEHSWLLITLWLSQYISRILFRSPVRLELWIIPLLLSLAPILACILFCTFYPPPFPFF